MLSAAQNATRSPETGDLELQIAMVAEARNQLNWMSTLRSPPTCDDR
jgi:hypothetical protein